MTRRAFPLLLALLAGCATTPPRQPHDEFFARLASLCGRAFEGRIASPPVEADRDFANRRLVMHVRDCSADEIRIPFQVGDDRSRTWIVTRRSGSIALAHDHRHDDGSEDRLSRYGGSTQAAGTAERQLFPADQYSRDLFVRENIPQSTANVWAMEVRPGEIFAYELRRPNRFFRVEFDLRRPVPPVADGVH